MSDDFVLPNLSTVDTSTMQNYTLLPPGDYDTIISGAKFELSKQKKTPCLNVEFTVTNQVGTTDTYKGRKLWRRFYFSPKALPILAEFLLKVNFRMNGERAHNANLANVNKAEFLGALTGCKARCKVVIKEDPGYDAKNEVRSFKEHPDNPKPPTHDKAMLGSATDAEHASDALSDVATEQTSAGPDEAPENLTM